MAKNTDKKSTEKTATPGAVTEAVKHIFDMTRLGEEFRADAIKFVQAAYDAGAESGKVSHEASAPLEHHEVSALRDSARALPDIANSLAALVGAFKK